MNTSKGSAPSLLTSLVCRERHFPRTSLAFSRAHTHHHCINCEDQGNIWLLSEPFSNSVDLGIPSDLPELLIIPMHTTQAYSSFYLASDLTNLPKTRILSRRQHCTLILPCSWTKLGFGAASNRQSSTMSLALRARSYPTVVKNEKSISEQEQKRHCMRRRKVSISTHHHSAQIRTGGRRWRLVLDHPPGKP